MEGNLLEILFLLFIILKTNLQEEKWMADFFTKYGTWHTWHVCWIIDSIIWNYSRSVGTYVCWIVLVYAVLFKKCMHVSWIFVLFSWRLIFIGSIIWAKCRGVSPSVRYSLKKLVQFLVPLFDKYGVL